MDASPKTVETCLGNISNDVSDGGIATQLRTCQLGAHLSGIKPFYEQH
jgi:hypothetical protein